MKNKIVSNVSISENINCPKMEYIYLVFTDKIFRNKQKYTRECFWFKKENA